ncbi:MAG: S1/P1 nuclease [Pyrinomonadaceae bacterium]|nr:S1/P1 nuclease [Pyrinomonadaceae bacterium]
MRQIALSTLFIAAIALFTASPSYAWDDVGHKITGYIAWQRMSPAAREKVVKILRSAPEDSHLSTFFLPYGPQSDEAKKLAYFMLVPTWADIVRDRTFAVRYEKYHHGNWHYDDTFWKLENGKVEFLSGFEEGGQAVPRLVEFEKVIIDPMKTDAEKAIAIAWIAHLTGDIHQPLHTSARVTDLEPKGDQGGNLFQLTPQGTPRDQALNLHWYWDSIVTRNIPYDNGFCDDEYVKSIAEAMMRAYPFEAERAKLTLGKYPDWQTENFQYAPTHVFSPDLKRFETPSDEYRRKAYRLAERQLAVAGYRLGETLNNVFGK